MTCPNCGAPLPENGECTYCGTTSAGIAAKKNAMNVAKFETAQNPDNPDNLYNQKGFFASPLRHKTFAIILSVVFGWFGITKFYEGKFISGLIYLILNVTHITVFLNIVDIIIIAKSPDIQGHPGMYDCRGVWVNVFDERGTVAKLLGQQMSKIKKD
jgi:hypothetical protein